MKHPVRGNRNMARGVLLVGLLIALLTGANGQSPTQSKSSNARATEAPQRTILTTSAGVQSDSSPAPALAAPDAPSDALEKYREMWRKMSPAQQKGLVDSGGYTLEQYERLLKPKGAASGPGGSADPRTKIYPTMDSLNKSLENLDTIRDANLSRIQAESCPPEVAARIADLKAKVRNYESESSGIPVAAAPARPRTSAAPADPLAIATDWYKSGAPAAEAGKASQQSQLVEAVLPGARAPAPRAVFSEQDITRAKTELEQLSGACAAPVR
jgi:hypothetical protein